jgi:hypothetical protein
VSDDAGTENHESAPTEAPTAERPTVETPTAEVPSPETPSTDPEVLQEHASEVDTDFRVLFWKIVFVYKFGLIGATLGALLIAFEGMYTEGGPLTVGGVALVAYGLYLTWRGKRRVDAGEFDMDVEDDTENENSVASDDTGETEDTDD